MYESPVGKTNSFAIAAIVFGVLGFLQIPPFVSPALSIIFAAFAEKQIYESDGFQKGKSLVTISRILSAAGVVISLLSVLVVVLFVLGGLSFIVKR